LFVDASGNVSIPTGSLTLTQSTAANVSLNNTSGNYLFLTAASENAFIDNRANGSLNYRGSGLNIWSVYGGSELMRLDSSGRLGLGTSSPGYPLTVNGRISYAGAIGEGADTTLSSSSTTVILADSATWQNLQFKTNGQSRLYINSSGNVGIGTTNPALKLSVDGDVWLGNGAGVEIGRLFNDSAVLHLRASSNVTGLALGTAGTERLRIQSGGNVGIGTTSPALKLSVDGDTWFGNGAGTEIGRLFNDSGVLHLRASSNVTGLALGTNGTERARLTSDGKFLVGTSTASGGALLQVNGDRIRVGTARTPASATDTGTAGEICWDANYVYVCTATNTWKRSALSAW
jgi:streptogramin lyase